MKKKGQILFILLSIGVAGALAYLRNQSLVRERWDLELTVLSRGLRPGESRGGVEELVNTYCDRIPARLIVSYDKKEWIVANPGRIGAQERALELKFDDQGALQHRTLRTTDNPRRSPADAPPDF